ncbi:hypothetical protein PTTG_27044 [Puccinia triticina 1-1 BBBD Race 1]|uniref:Uncharacterized protein n=1 Tax=Puccinia triticina (isolate 1-1 / race 1 (BBBD)) TaxID=630390 RepID=A0A180GQD5_PUCT1|nr:hypothetical protein PTTG_27044 [Puccinia triticina 1-1 BBBD Race 1]
MRKSHVYAYNKQICYSSSYTRTDADALRDINLYKPSSYRVYRRAHSPQSLV